MTQSPGSADREALFAELGAYIDQELRPEEARAVERRLFRDPGALTLLQGLRADQCRLKADLDQVTAMPPPERLLDAVQAGFDAHGGQGAAAHDAAAHDGGSGGRGMRVAVGPPSWWALAAASLAFLMVGAGAGLYWAESRLGDALRHFEARSELERSVIASTVSRALESRVSGEPVDWRSGEVSGQVVPLRTYRSQSGHWCREYRRVTRFKDGPISVLALACRSDDGQWVTIRAEPQAAGSLGDQL